MRPVDSDPTQEKRASQAAAACARELGLSFREAVLLRNGSNLLLHLQPAPVVARVAVGTGKVRQGTAWLERELRVAGFLHQQGQPVAPPSREVAPGPHLVQGLALSFWEFVPTTGTPADAAQAGRALAHCHEALANYTGELTAWSAWQETRTILSWLRRHTEPEHFAREDLFLLEELWLYIDDRLHALDLPLQPVHGDAHLGNVLASRSGVLWNDWKDTHLAPLGWDLACLQMPAHVQAQDVERIAAAGKAYSEVRPVDRPACGQATLLAARTLQVASWAALLLMDWPQVRERLDLRLAWLRRWAKEHGLGPG